MHGIGPDVRTDTARRNVVSLAIYQIRNMNTEHVLSKVWNFNTDKGTVSKILASLCLF